VSRRTIRLQRAKDEKSIPDYFQWTSSLSAEEFQKLVDLDVSKPEVSYHGKAASKQDFADSPAASCWPDIAALIDRDHEDEPELSPVVRAGDILRHFLAEVLPHKNIRLTFECLALVVGLRARDGKSMTAIAKDHGITAAAVGRHCVKFSKEFGFNQKNESGLSPVVDAGNILRHFIAEVLAHKNVRLTIECMALLVGLSACDGRSMTAIGKDHGISAAAVSKRCGKFAKEFGIKYSRAMRSLEARNAYQAGQLKRNRKDQP
jgi:hypothetical protein